MSNHPFWPLFNLVVKTPLLNLVHPDDAMIAELAELAARGIHDPAVMPFGVPWTDLPSDGTQQRSSMQHMWANRANFQPDNWHLSMAVVIDEQVVGVQGALAKDFGKLGVFETGSWLGQAYQGKGIGKEMRSAILHLMFDCFNATEATTRAWAFNEASNGVTRSLGYEPNGRETKLNRDQPTESNDYTLSRSRWEQQRRDDITVFGAEECRRLVGLI